MADNNVTQLHKPDNRLNELLKQVAQQLLAQAIETEVQELLAVVDGYWESADCWQEVLTQLDSQGLQAAPELMIGDGA